MTVLLALFGGPPANVTPVGPHISALMFPIPEEI